MVKKAFRELLRMAQSEGVDDPWIDAGIPHDRLVGLLDGEPFEIVISRNFLGGHRSHKMARGNIRREVARMRHARLMVLAKRMLEEKTMAEAAA